MIILIGGPGCSGKTLLAQKILEQYKIPYLSVDHLKMGLIKGWKNYGFNAEDDDLVIADKILSIISNIIYTNLENDQNIIVEGCYLLPEYLSEIVAKYPQEIKAFCVIYSRDYILNNYEAGIMKHRNAIEKRKYPEHRNISQVIAEHQNLKNQCDLYNVKYIEVTKDFEREVLVDYNKFLE